MSATTAATREHRFVTPDGAQLFVRDWLVDRPHGTVVILHGIGEHCGRYLHVARFLNERGWSVRTYDHRGHGQSTGKRGDAPDREAHVRDAETMIADFARTTGDTPILFGHSMGGLFAARVATAARVPLRALVLSSPALAIPLTSFQKLLLKFMSAVAPGIAVKNNLPLRYLSHDDKVIQAYSNDPLVHDRITANLLNAMLAAVDFSHAHASSLAIPVLLQVAGDDHLVDASGSKAFHARLPVQQCTLRWYDGLYHEIYNERDARPVFDDLGLWLDCLLDSGATREASAA